MNKLLTIIKKKVVYIPLGILVLIIGGIALYSATNKTVYETAKVERRSFTQEVSVTGKVVAAQDVSLGFETGGRVTSIPATVGMKVYKGMGLAYVGNADQRATVLDQQARLQSAQAALDEVLRGTRPTELSQIKNTAAQAEESLVNVIRDSYADSDDSVRSKIDNLYINPTGIRPNFVNFGNGVKESNLEDKRVEIGAMLLSWKKSVEKLEQEGYSQSYLEEARVNLGTMRAFVDELAVASSYFNANEDLSDAEVEAYISYISSARSSVNTAIASLSGAVLTYTQAMDNLELTTEGATPEEVTRAEATVKSAQANLLQAQAALSKTAIVAPFDGIVTKIDLKAGQLVSPSSDAISMISNANFEIESYIPEADIAKVKVGNTGTTTLDAYGDKVTFIVVVTAIDLSETEVDGVSTYKTTLQFSASDDRIRSGMTANIDLVSETREGVISVPQTALISQSGKRSVMVMNDNGKTESRSIKTGAIDNSGNIEITDGLSEGETVVTNPTK